MFFIGYFALAGTHSADATPTSVENITSTELENGIYDDDFITSDTSSSTIPLSTNWDYKTKLHAQFNGNLLAGNVDFVLGNVEYILTKVREYGTYNWINVFSNTVTDEASLTFENFYRYCKSNTTYQFALVPVMAGNIEGNYNINTVDSYFGGMYIFEKDNGYYTDLENKIPDRQKNRPYSLINTLSGKYPYVIYSSANQYDTFTVSGSFYKTVNDEYDPVNSYDYRDELMMFLSDCQPKIIKDYTGRCWIVAIQTDSIKESQTEYTDAFITSFSAIEIGSPSSQSDLVNCNLVGEISE